MNKQKDGDEGEATDGWRSYRNTASTSGSPGEVNTILCFRGQDADIRVVGRCAADRRVEHGRDTEYRAEKGGRYGPPTKGNVWSDYCYATAKMPTARGSAME